MTCLDPKKMVLNVGSREILPIKDVDAHFVLGVPFRGKPVSHEIRPAKDVVSTVLGKLSIGGHPGSFTLEYLEWILAKNYEGKMDEGEKEAFKISVVLYSMACFLAGPIPKKGFPIWLVKNCIEPTKISQFNWCGYILSVLAHAALEVQEQIRKGDEIVKLHGCTFLLLILYLDNLDFGCSSAVHLDIPRAHVYNKEYLTHLIELDRNQHLGSGIVQYGRHKLRTGTEVVYSRAWDGESYGEWGDYDKHFVTPSELFHNIIVYDPDIAEMCAGPLAKISAREAYQIRKTYKNWYAGYTCIFSGLPAGTFSTTKGEVLEDWGQCSADNCVVEASTKTEARSQKRQKLDLVAHTFKESGPITGEPVSKSIGDPQKSALQLLAEEASKEDICDIARSGTAHVKEFVFQGGFSKKLVTEHSKFPKSPFELGRFMHTITWRKKTALLDWLDPGAEDWGHLTRIWVHIDYPAPLYLLGYDLKTQLSPHGSFTPPMVDAITRTSIQFDEVAYGPQASRWRHFLPARFAEVVLREEDYLASEEIKKHFIGEHIGYPVENCRLISTQVYYHGRWSCYLWDFQKKKVIVLDPTRMGLQSANVELHHGHLVVKLTKALFECIGRFFSGWDFDASKWDEMYPTHHGSRSKIYNSGLYSILYSRYFDGQQLVCTPNQGGLIEPRSALLYELLTIKGNKVKLPARFQDIVTKPWLRKGSWSLVISIFWELEQWVTKLVK